MEGSTMLVSLDKLPIRRLNAIEENGVEHFPPREVSPDEKLLSLLHGIDFTPLVAERDAKKAKVSKESQSAAAPQWPWQGLVENLQQAHQELSVILDLINNVEANDAVAVAGMTKPKPLPTEQLSDLSISLSTKLQCFRHLGKYLKQSAKALEQQVARESRFYGALSRLQQNWKVKRQRTLASAAGNEGFTIDLSNSTSDPPTSLLISASMVRIDHDPMGMLTVSVPPKSCHTVQLGFLGVKATERHKRVSTNVANDPAEASWGGKEEIISDEYINTNVRATHSLLCNIHLSIFDELVFDLVNREALSPNPGVYVAGMHENFVLLSIGQEASVFLRLLSSGKDAEEAAFDGLESVEAMSIPGQTMEGTVVATKKHDQIKKDIQRLPNPLSFEIYLQQLVHETLLLRLKERYSSEKSLGSIPPAGGLLSHFCLTLAHRIFSYKVLSKLEDLVSRVPYLLLVSHPTWHSRTSTWSLFLDVPETILNLHANRQPNSSNLDVLRRRIMSRFHNKVIVNEECIKVAGEGAPNVVGLFVSDSMKISPTINHYDCDLENLSLVILEQIASQIVHWLFEEALILGLKATRDLLRLSFELEQGDKLSLVAHLDPEDEYRCLTWWLLIEESVPEEVPIQVDFVGNGDSDSRRFLGHLSLGELYALLMDLVALCNSTGA